MRVSFDMYTRPTRSIIHVPLQVNRFQNCFLLIVQYKYLKSCSWRFYSQESDPPHKTMRYDVYYSTLLCCWLPPDRNLSGKWFVLAVYQFRKGISAGPALKIFYKIHRGGRMDVYTKMLRHLRCLTVSPFGMSAVSHCVSMVHIYVHKLYVYVHK